MFCGAIDVKSVIVKLCIYRNRAKRCGDVFCSGGLPVFPALGFVEIHGGGEAGVFED